MVCRVTEMKGRGDLGEGTVLLMQAEAIINDLQQLHMEGHNATGTTGGCNNVMQQSTSLQ